MANTQTEATINRATIRKILLSERGAMAKLADDSGFHPAQISSVLRGEPNVGKAKREQIIRAARERAQKILEAQTVSAA